MRDLLGREIDYIRISVTDRCNLRCIYCMPEEGVKSLEHTEILRFEEILDIVRCSAKLGFKKVKITGGEPLVRKGILQFLKQVKNIEGIENVTLTTNGILIPDVIGELKDTGIDGINISLDTLNKERYEQITRRDELNRVLKAVDLCVENGIKTKVNCVVMPNKNEDELCDIAGLAKDKNICVRFIEMMPVGGKKDTVSNKQVLKKLEGCFGTFEFDTKMHGNGPAVYYTRDDFKGRIGLISALSDCFCESCNRVRLTADGFLKLCLQYSSGVDLRTPLRQGADEEELTDIIKNAILNKPKQHSFKDFNGKSDIECKGMSQIGG